MKSWINWLDERTGCKSIARAAIWNIPGGPRWRYVWFSTILFCIVIQIVTGTILWMNYSPGAQTAWESVNRIQNELTGGWLLRGLHHFTAQLLPVLLALHVMQVVIDGAYKAPREVNFWCTILLSLLVLAIALTGYQLPWDQKGFWATKVAVNVLGIVPFVGPRLQRILIGGPDYGHLTLTHFFAVHAGILPAILLLVLLAHATLFFRSGFVGKKSTTRADAPWWPDQALRNAVACLAVVITLLLLVFRHRLLSSTGLLGAELGAPADPSEPYSAARPEWYFLFLYQFLKLFPARMEIVGAIIIPGILVTIVFLMPFIGRSRTGHRFNIGFLSCLFVGMGWLTYVANSSDAKNPEYQKAVEAADREAARVKVLVNSPLGVPTSGAITLLREDAFTQGPKLFAKHCADCHRYAGHDGLGNAVSDAPNAADLEGFGSRKWLEGLLDPKAVSSTKFFGGTKFKHGKMAKFVQKKIASYTPEQKVQITKVIVALSAEAGLKAQRYLDHRDAHLIAEGRVLLKGAMGCTDCHQFRSKDESATAPDLTGYGSRDWLRRFLNNPGHPQFYGEENGRMPAFGEKHILTDEQIGLLLDWLRGDWYEPTKAKY
jgi:ubiquinol-cytochrome c reductase cytochrome b subunit